MNTQIQEAKNSFPEKLFVCLNEDNHLSLETRIDVDAVIKHVEEDFEGSMPFTVVGNITVPMEGIAFLFTCKTPSSIFYEVITGNSEEDAKISLATKKRLRNKRWTIARTQNLTKLINDYYN